MDEAAKQPNVKRETVKKMDEKIPPTDAMKRDLLERLQFMSRNTNIDKDALDDALEQVSSCFSGYQNKNNKTQQPHIKVVRCCHVRPGRGMGS